MDLVPCPTPLIHCHCKVLFGSWSHKSHREAASSLLAHTCRGNVPRGRIRHALRTLGNKPTPEGAWDGLPSFKATSSFFDLQSSWESRGSEDGTSFLEAAPGEPCTGSCWRRQLWAASASKSLTRAGLGFRYRHWELRTNWAALAEGVRELWGVVTPALRVWPVCVTALQMMDVSRAADFQYGLKKMEQRCFLGFFWFSLS